MPRKTTPLLSEAVESYVRVRGVTLAKTTIANDASMLRRFVREVGDRPTHKLDHATVEEWFAAESARCQGSSFNKTRGRFVRFIAFATDRGWLDVNPMSAIGCRKVVEKDRMRLTAHELVRMIESEPNPRNRALLAVAANTGLRSSDVVALKVGDVDLDAGEIRMTIQKTGRAERLPITSDLDRELRRWLSYYAERLALLGMPLEGSMTLLPPLGPSNVRHDGQMLLYGDPRPRSRMLKTAPVVKRALGRIGVAGFEQDGHAIHMIRRSVARILFDQLVDQGYDGALRVVASLLGHRQLATTEQYLGLTIERQKRDAFLRGRSLLGTTDVVPLKKVARS